MMRMRCVMMKTAPSPVSAMKGTQGMEQCAPVWHRYYDVLFYDSTVVGIDVDECETGHSCHQNADCINNPGSFSCQCHNMFQGDGFNCTSESIDIQHRL